jgi:uncharacterized protein
MFIIFVFEEEKRIKMPRKKRYRTIYKPPVIAGFKPYGGPENLELVHLNIEEYEAVRLADYENLTHEESSVRMKVSRPTFTRIVDSARKKIAVSLCESRELIIEGGDYKYDIQWYKCNKCLFTFHNGTLAYRDSNCPLCGDKKAILINDKDKRRNDMPGKGMNQQSGTGKLGPGGNCVCVKCGKMVTHKKGVPCSEEKCPDCGASMVRENSYHHELLKEKQNKKNS